MNHEQFWQRVDDLLDARRDPLDDPQVRRHLEEHADLLEDYAELASAIGACEVVPRPRSWRRAAVAGVALLVLGGGFTNWHLATAGRNVERNVEHDPVIELPDLADDAEVMNFSCRTYTNGPDGQVERHVQGLAHTIHERETRRHVQPGVSTPHGHSIRTEWSYLSSRVRPEHDSQ